MQEDSTSPQTPQVSKEEADLAAASKDLDQPISSAPETKHTKVVGGQVKKSPKKKWILVITVLLALVAIGIYLLLLRSDTAQSPIESKSTKDASTAAIVAKSYQPNLIPYAYKANSIDPYTIYYRPALGGERKEAIKLERDDYIITTDVVGIVAAFTTSQKLYVSTDGGKTYSAVYTAKSSEEINSMKIAFEETSIALALYPSNGATKPYVLQMDLDGQNQKKLYQEDSASYLIGWSTKKQSIAYWLGCWACDGGRTAWKLRDLKGNSSKDLVAGIDAKTFYYKVAISPDMTSLMYVQTTYDPAIKEEGPPGYYAAAPYKVFQADIASGKSTLIDTIGKKQEKNANGTDKIRRINLGFLAGTSTGYYSEGASLFKVTGGKGTELYKSNQQIQEVYFASDKYVVLSTAADVSATDFSLSTTLPTGDKGYDILQGDVNTVIFGVSSK